MKNRVDGGERRSEIVDLQPVFKKTGMGGGVDVCAALF